MEIKRHSFAAPRVIIGLGIITLGILFLLGNLDILDPHEYIRLWPAILIVIGLSYIIQCQNGSGRIWGIILTFAGSAMLLDRLYFINFNLWDYWPLILVFIGAMMIVKSSMLRRSTESSPVSGSTDTNDRMNAIAIVGGSKRSSSSQNFKGGELTAIMGGLEIDLRDASISNEAVIDITAIMGGIEMRVPDDWIVIVEGFPFLGGFEDSTRPPKESTKRLVVKGTAIMGGVEIKN